jgi:multisubunit Na+/H+ antiporter MnhG subunit
MAVLGAATVCYELSALLIIVGIGYLAWQWIASLPVSIAIVVGALIIASAMRR